MSKEDKNKPLELDIELIEKGVEEVKEELDKITNEMIQAMVDEMIEFVYGVMGIAMRKAPKDTGNLRGSAVATIEKIQVAHTETDEGSDEGAKMIQDLKEGKMTLTEFLNVYSGEIIFNTSYATNQHENLSYSHTDGEAKFLENAITSQQDKFAKEIAKMVKKKGGT